MLGCMALTLVSSFCEARVTNVPQQNAAIQTREWTSIVSASARQDGPLVTLQLTTAAVIPHSTATQCAFRFVLQPVHRGISSGRSEELLPKRAIQFDLSNWDGSPWFATSVYTYSGGAANPPDTSRMFDWRLTSDTLKVRFSLDGLSWTGVSWYAEITYGGKSASRFPITGFQKLEIDSAFVHPLKSVAGSHSSFTFPSPFEAVMKRESVATVVSRAYEYERALTEIMPVCGDTASYVFNRYYDGAAIEGKPIGMGPGMWGRQAPWFVYFHEMGHDYCNASARFRQLYPLTMGLPRGPLPANILFYEGWASLPAMYAFAMIVGDSASQGLSPQVYESVKKGWTEIQKRFTAEWKKYQEHPALDKVNPDIVDGLFLELQREHGWQFFKRFYALMRPQDKTLSLFDDRVTNDSTDLRLTRWTLTAAIFSALAHKDLREDFKRWDFPVDTRLFDNTYHELLNYLEKERI